MRPALFMAALSLVSGLASQAQAAPDRIETPVRERQCRNPPEIEGRYYNQQGLGALRCPAPPGYEILLVSSPTQQWLDISGPTHTWSSERLIRQQKLPGGAPRMGGPVSWLAQSPERWQGLVFLLYSQDEQYRYHEAYVAVSLGDGGICPLGVFPFRREAENAVRQGQACLSEDVTRP
jgi:hypothetical protein